MYSSLIANVVLCVLQRAQFFCHDYTRLTQQSVYAAITAGSLSLLATGIDAVFDIGSNVVLFWLHRKAVRLDVNKWPVGGARLETIGNVIYGQPDFKKNCKQSNLSYSRISVRIPSRLKQEHCWR